jgi:hypothetical protein
MTIYNPEEYIANLPLDRQEPMSQLRAVIKGHLPEGFEEVGSENAISYVVPHKIYPAGYHCDPSSPLPFISIVSQKNFISLYHMGIYADDDLLEWFVDSYAEVCKYKLDMGKSCIRLKRMNDIPYELIAELATKMTVGDWVSRYDGLKPA